MKINSVYIENIKKFGQLGHRFSLEGDYKICTVSGSNGSGKTAVFKAIQLFQKFFFFSQLPSESSIETRDTLRKNIESLSSGDNIKTSLDFTIGKESLSSELSITTNEFDFDFKLTDLIKGSNNKLIKLWDINNPKSIIVVLDAGKSFSEFGVNFNNINLKPRNQKKAEFIIDCIFNPDETLQAIYKRTVLDHIHYRLDPSRTYDHFKAANKAIKTISANLDIKNVSATRKDGHLVILGRTSNDVSIIRHKRL